MSKTAPGIFSKTAYYLPEILATTGAAISLYGAYVATKDTSTLPQLASIFMSSAAVLVSASTGKTVRQMAETLIETDETLKKTAETQASRFEFLR